VVDELMSGRPPKPRILVITTYEDEEDIRGAVKAGARGYLVKTADYEEIEEAVRAVAAGRSLFPAAITLKLLEAVARPELSQRELGSTFHCQWQKQQGNRERTLHQRAHGQRSR
jgi:DNA-binding NarL/FixJ family response regulator